MSDVTENTATQPRTFADAEVVLAEALPGYESRPQQQSLAEAIERALDEEVHLIAEAGCGTGKSFATAIPAILSGKRVLMATATKALQDQIATKDLPFLAEHLGVDFHFAVLKGRSNYLCKAKVHSPEVAEQVVSIRSVRERMEDLSFNGERDDLGFAIENREWVNLTTSADECPGRKTCPWGDECYAEFAKREALAADIVVVNHALLMTDLVISGGHGAMLGPVDAIVVDEAHELEEYALNALSSRFTEVGLRNFATEVRNFANSHLVNGDAVVDLADDLSAAINQLWAIIEPGRLRPSAIVEHADEWVEMANTLTALHEALKEGVLEDKHDDKVAGRKAILVQRARKTSESFVDIVASADDQLVRWIEEETTRRGEKRLIIQAAPIDIAPILRTILFERTPTVMVSATLAVDGKFEYIAGRLGVDLVGYRSLNVGTPFDFQSQSALYVPAHLPIPSGSTRDAWASMAINEMLELVRISEGRALLLFTSIAQMRSAYEMISPRIEHLCLMQGDAPNKFLAEEFKRDVHSVLFATRSFFTGVDFPGETLSLVVIDKLPFPVPTEPLVEARCEIIKSRNGNDFSEYTVPVMSLVLAQGFGRLIRTQTDRGVVAILDPRLTSKGYGKRIIRSLPDARLIEHQGQVRDFFAEG